MTRTKPGTPEADAFAIQADRLWQNRDFQAVYDKIYKSMVADVEVTLIDGSPEKDREALEKVRKLQAFISIKRAMAISVQSSDIRTRKRTARKKTT